MNRITIVVIGILAVGGGSFYAGMRVGGGGNPVVARGGMGGFGNLSPEEREARLRQLGGAGFVDGGLRGARGGAAPGGFVAGEIIAKDSESITVKLGDDRASVRSENGSDGQGGSKIIFFTADTQVVKSVSGTPADLSVGETIAVTGTPNPDGSVNAKSIQIRPFAPANQRQTNQ